MAMLKYWWDYNLQEQTGWFITIYKKLNTMIIQYPQKKPKIGYNSTNGQTFYTNLSLMTSLHISCEEYNLIINILNGDMKLAVLNLSHSTLSEFCYDSINNSKNITVEYSEADYVIQP